MEMSRSSLEGEEISSDHATFFSCDELRMSIRRLQDRKTDIEKYSCIQKMIFDTDVSCDLSFQKLFVRFYRLRRDFAWRTYYFELFEKMKKRNPEDVSFGEIQLRLLQYSGQIESSFSSKMLASLKPDMPIWDSIVLKNLGLRLKGRTKEERFSRAVVLYERINEWYRRFLITDQAQIMVQAFDSTFPEYCHLTSVKKIDFLLWAKR